jgi:hypothetical protein
VRLNATARGRRASAILAATDVEAAIFAASHAKRASVSGDGGASGREGVGGTLAAASRRSLLTPVDPVVTTLMEIAKSDAEERASFEASVGGGGGGAGAHGVVPGGGAGAAAAAAGASVSAKAVADAAAAASATAARLAGAGAGASYAVGSSSAADEADDDADEAAAAEAAGRVAPGDGEEGGARRGSRADAGTVEEVAETRRLDKLRAAAARASASSSTKVVGGILVTDPTKAAAAEAQLARDKRA